ncbi:hypothetical protein HB912_01670 [Listeria aquatica]|uniref:Bacterial Ig domain-containing protein n=1 Tax=Listeria aquatica TaxID=1494960 RepID=A0A841ZNS1_9LIST|nr:immunoglobulin-like domain-containing protein [Listeria aquatica]MBC1520351.1 hypothetical protein [Listeria aquatica]
MKKKSLKKGSILVVVASLTASQLLLTSPALAKQPSKNTENETTASVRAKNFNELQGSGKENGLKAGSSNFKRTLAVSPRATEIPVTVATPAELESALSLQSNANVIKLANDITLMKDINLSKSVRIEGNGYKLSFSGKKIAVSGFTRIDLLNVALYNGSNGSNVAMFTQNGANSNPAINVLGDVTSNGFLIDATNGGALTISGKHNTFTGNQSSMIANVNQFKVEDNAQIDRMEAVKNAIQVSTAGNISIGKNALINIRSNTGYAFSGDRSTLLVDEGAKVVSNSQFGAFSVGFLQINNGASINIASGVNGGNGTGIRSVSGVSTGDNVNLDIKVSGNGIETTGASSNVKLGLNNKLDITSTSSSGIVTKGFSSGVGSDIAINALRDGITADVGGVKIGEISNQPVAGEKRTVKINSGNASGINSRGDINLGDNINFDIQSYFNSLGLGTGQTPAMINIGSYSHVEATSANNMGISAASMKIGNDTDLSLSSLQTGINLGNDGSGLATGKNVKIKINAGGDGISSGKNLSFDQNNELDIKALSGNGMSTINSAKIELAEKNLLKIQARLGIRQTGNASLFHLNRLSALRIYNTEQHGIFTDGTTMFDENTTVGISTAQGGNYSAIKANSKIQFNEGSKLNIQTLSNQSTSVFDLSGADSSRLEIIKPTLMDIRQSNHFTPGLGRLIQGRGNGNAAFQTHFIMDTVAKLYSWNRGQAWSTSPTNSWKNVSSDTIFVPNLNNVNYNYFGGPTVGDNVTGFDIYSYSRLATRSDSSNLLPTTIEKLTTTSTSVKGTAEPGADIEIKVADQTIGHGTVSADGTYNVSIPAQKAGVQVSAQAFVGTDKSNVASTAVISATAGTIMPDPYTADETELTGNYTGDVVKAKLYVNGKYISTGGSFKAPKFSYYVKKGTIKVGDKVELEVLDSTDKILDKKVVQVNKVQTGSVSPNPFTVNSSAITGSYTGDVAQGQLFVNGKHISTGGTFTSGKFSYYVKAHSIKATDKVELAVFDKTQKILDRKPVQVIGTAKGTLTPNPFTVGSSLITGSYSGDIVQGQLFINGKYVSKGGTFSKGQFSYYVKVGTVKATDKVELVGLDKNKKVLDRKNVQVNGVLVGSVMPNHYVPGTTSITGTYSGDVVKGQLYVNGKYVSTGGTFSSGKFSYYVKAGTIREGDKVELVALDKNKKVLDRKLVPTAVLKGEVTPKVYTLGNSTITGTYTGSVAKIQLLIDGKSISWGGNFLSDGTFSYYVKSGLIKEKSKVEIIAYDAEDKSLDRKVVPVKSNIEGKFISATYKIGDTIIKGTFDGDISVAKVYINGVPGAWGGDFNVGAFSYFVGKNKIKKDDIVKLEGYSQNTKLLDTVTVKIVD